LSNSRVQIPYFTSKRKGLWTGGTVPLGYDVKDKQLIPNKKEVEQVNNLFKAYLEFYWSQWRIVTRKIDGQTVKEVSEGLVRRRAKEWSWGGWNNFGEKEN
jgi:DNA invertase Pin-like site-specific DNA recombinase